MLRQKGAALTRRAGGPAGGAPPKAPARPRPRRHRIQLRTDLAYSQLHVALVTFPALPLPREIDLLSLGISGSFCVKLCQSGRLKAPPTRRLRVRVPGACVNAASHPTLSIVSLPIHTTG